VVVVFGVFLGRKYKSAADYFLAARSMTWPLIGISLFASNISSITLVGLADNAYGSGIAVYNYEWMAAIVLVLFAFFLPFYLRARIYTVPEFLEKRFDSRVQAYLWTDTFYYAESVSVVSKLSNFSRGFTGFNRVNRWGILVEFAHNDNH
jgi:uncharacterized sodium:solute symporter family permease YidK